VTPPRALSLVTDVDARADSLVATFTEDLAESDTGIEFVYRSLERVRERSKADDVLVIVDDTPLGRQAFRAARDPIETSWARDLIRTGDAGLHATPNHIDPAVAASVANLCALALRLDVARHDSLHDPLTGLLNRRAFDELLAASCARSERYGWSFALVMIDLDNFKAVNDRLGHAAGDAALRAVGVELRGRLRAGDAASRMGGDEFALLLPSVEGSIVPDLVRRLEQAVEDAVPEASITFTVGAAQAPADAVDPRLLFRIADQRLYEGKHR
jgi:diguanylate cyclase